MKAYLLAAFIATAMIGGFVVVSFFSHSALADNVN